MKNLSGTAKISLMLLSIFLLSTLGLWFAVTVTANPTASVDATINFNTTRIYNYDGYDRYVYDMADTMQIEIQNNDEAANNDTLVAETINVTINSSESLGSINVTLTETGANTGIFRVNIGFKTGVSDGNNNLINVTNLFEENITITYVDHAHSSGLNTSVINVSLFDENRPSLGDNTTINFGSIVAPGSNIKPVIKINNNGTWNETSLTQQITVYKHYELKYNGIDDTRHVNFMLSNITDYFVWNVTSNSTTISIYPKVYDENGTLLSSNMNGTYDVIMAGTDAKIWYIKVKNNDTATADGINITVDVYQTGLVTSNFTSSDYFLPNNFSTDMELNLTLPSVGIYGGWYNGTLKYYNDNFNTSIPIIFNVSAPEMWIETNISSPMRLMPNGTVVYKLNYFRGIADNGGRNIKIYVNNTGSSNLTNVWANLTLNFTNGTSIINVSSIAANLSNGTDYQITNYGLMYLGNILVDSNSNITLFFNVSDFGEGDYDTMILFSSDNGQPFTDANLTLRINVTHNLDITANSITAYTYANSSSLTAPV
ncbi:MAG: hypothetical protein KKG13_00005, partial [Nanoarchaeota archaeon]|nr:hypothetical protein [Nanoarchaeota archaeon]